MEVTRDEMRRRRLAWAAYLKEPGRKKTWTFLDTGDGHRCCLGHGCVVAGIPDFPANDERITKKRVYGSQRKISTAPREMMEYFGLLSERGEIPGGYELSRGDDEDKIFSLVAANDAPGIDLTPYEIGVIIENTVEGGDHTPFKPLEDYDAED